MHKNKGMFMHVNVCFSAALFTEGLLSGYIRSLPLFLSKRKIWIRKEWKTA